MLFFKRRLIKTPCLVGLVAVIHICPAYADNTENKLAHPAPIVQSQPQTVPPAKSTVYSKPAVIERLLNDADRAMRQGRLMQPPQDNAYDRLRAILLLEPNNSKAQAALNSILFYCMERIQAALRDGRLTQANAELRRAQQYFPRAPQLLPLAKSVMARNQQVQAAVVRAIPGGSSTPADSGRRVVLPAKALSSKGAEIKNLLANLAKRSQAGDETIMIYARSDVEGRWIYNAMRDAVTDYRIRGDIRIAKQPSIEFLEPIAESN
jgi:hypothetical protein